MTTYMPHGQIFFVSSVTVRSHSPSVSLCNTLVSSYSVLVCHSVTLSGCQSRLLLSLAIGIEYHYIEQLS